MDDLNGDPVCIEITMAADLVEGTYTLDTDNYPVDGGTSPLLADRTIKVSSIAMFIDDALDILAYLKIDDHLVTEVPYSKNAPVLATDWQTINIQALFGKPYIPLRSTIKWKKSGTAVPVANKIYVFGIATQSRTE